MIYIATDNFNDGFPLSNAYDDTIYQKANGEYYLKFRFPVDRLGVWKHLTCETVLKADDTRGLQLFKIKKINKINGYIRVYAKHISDDLNYIGVDKLTVTNATGRRVMEALAGSTTEQHNFIFNSDIATMHTLNLSNTTAGKILSKDKHSIIGQWGGELVRDNFLIDLKARAGVDTEILFMNKKNVKNLDNAISTENLTTRLKLIVEKEHEGKKQTITATVDSPNINAYPRIYTNYLKVSNNNIETQQQLIEYGVKYFKDSLVDFPTDNLTVNVIDKNQEQVRLFDTVWFRNVDFNIDKRLKVVAYEYSPMAKRYKKISFGALKVSNLSQIKSLSQLEDKIEEKVSESFVDAFKIQKNLSELLKLDRKGIEDKLVELEEKSKGALEVKKALFDADGTIPDVVKAKILDAVEGDIGRLKTIITEAELIKAIQAKLNFAEIKNALIDKAFINQIISDEKFTQQFEDGEVTTQNIFTKLKDSIKSNISKEFVTKDGVKKLVNDLTIDADGIRQITQQESVKVFENKKQELKGANAYLHKKYSDYSDGRNMSDNSTLKYIGIYTGDKEQAPTNASEYSWTKIKGEDGHNLTANLRFEGRYVNNIVTNLSTFVDVFYDGQKITDGFELKVKHKGMGASNWTDFISRPYDNTGRLTNFIFSNGEKDGTPLEVIALVTYKGLNIVATERIENMPDVMLLSETIKKYKTFESTIDGFTSVVGEIDTKVLSKAYFKNNLNNEDVEKTGNDLYFNAKENLQANEYYTILADLDNVPDNQQSYIYGASDGGDKKTIQNGLNYWVVKYSTNQTKINLYPLGANTKVKNVKIYKGDFRVKKDGELKNLYSNSATDSGGKFIHLNLNKNKINGNVYMVKFDASGYSNGDKWDIYNRIGYDENNLTQVFKSKGNELTFTINDNTTVDRIYLRMKLVGNTTISNVEIYDVSTEYVKNKEITKLESSITQTKNEIDLKVSKNDVIASINASVETTGTGTNQGVVKIKGEVLADNIHGKTFTGSKFKIGQYGFLQPIEKGLQINAPENFGSKRGIGLQIAGEGVGPKENGVPPGLFIYEDPDFTSGHTVPNAVNRVLLTVAGMACFSSRVSGSIVKGQPILTNLDSNFPFSSTYPVKFIGYQEGGFMRFFGTDNDNTNIWNIKVDTWGSDRKLKTDIKDSEFNAIEFVEKLKFKDHGWNKDEIGYEKPHTKCGLIAQEVQELDESLVVDYGEYLGLDGLRLINISLKAIQELSKENTNLKSQLKKMNERLQKLEDKINGNI
nr:MAG TPA: Neck appendage protein [Caudoviricetes sp.]